jgi:archaeosortase family protein ArtE
MSTSGESDKTENKQEIRGKILFLIEFYAVFLIIYFVLMHFEEYLVGIVAYISYIFTKLIIPDAILVDNLIFLPNNTVEIVKECTGRFLLSGFLALVIVYSRDIKEYIIGLFFVVLAFFTNILRIVLVCYLVNEHPQDPWTYHELAGYGVILTLVPILVALYLNVIDKLRGEKCSS